jgi:hypothetical protein
VQNYRLFVSLGKGELRPEKGNLHLPRSIARKVQTYLANGIRSGNCRLDRREVGIERVPRVNAHSLNGLRACLRIMRVNVQNHCNGKDSEKITIIVKIITQKRITRRKKSYIRTRKIEKQIFLTQIILFTN